MSNAISENDERENSQNFEIIFEKVKATFSNPDKVPRERDIIERWVSSEFNITIEEPLIGLNCNGKSIILSEVVPSVTYRNTVWLL